MFDKPYLINQYVECDLLISLLETQCCKYFVISQVFYLIHRQKKTFLFKSSIYYQNSINSLCTRRSVKIIIS